MERWAGRGNLPRHMTAGSVLPGHRRISAGTQSNGAESPVSATPRTVRYANLPLLDARPHLSDLRRENDYGMISSAPLRVPAGGESMSVPSPGRRDDGWKLVANEAM